MDFNNFSFLELTQNYKNLDFKIDSQFTSEFQEIIKKSTLIITYDFGFKKHNETTFLDLNVYLKNTGYFKTVKIIVSNKDKNEILKLISDIINQL